MTPVASDTAPSSTRSRKKKRKGKPIDEALKKSISWEIDQLTESESQASAGESDLGARRAWKPMKPQENVKLRSAKEIDSFIFDTKELDKTDEQFSKRAPARQRSVAPSRTPADPKYVMN